MSFTTVTSVQRLPDRVALSRPLGGDSPSKHVKQLSAGKLKFAHVKTRLSTGKSVAAVKPKRPTTGELYTRLSANGLVTRIVSNHRLIEPSSRHQRSGSDSSNSASDDGSDADASVGVCDYVILDVRSSDEFDADHIINAESTSLSRLLRHQYGHNLLRARHREDILVAIYDATDPPQSAGAGQRTAFECANALVERGWTTVHVLTDGFDAFKQSYPHLVTDLSPSASSELANIASVTASADNSRGGSVIGSRLVSRDVSPERVPANTVTTAATERRARRDRPVTGKVGDMESVNEDRRSMQSRVDRLRIR